MLLSLVIIVALVWAAVIGTIYSNFLVFYSNFAETDNYNKAYYASIVALERAELVTKQRQPWFEWTGGRVDNTGIDDTFASDFPIVNDFSYLATNNAKISTSKWHIDSLTNRIPKQWNWNVDRMLSATDSSDFNKMDYNNAEVFLLYRDPHTSTSSNPYEKLDKGGMERSIVSEVTGEIRLPAYLKETFWDLNTQSWLMLSEETNDAIVDWQVMWNYAGQQFTIFATQSTTNWNVNASKDTAIRESDLNNGLAFSFWEMSHRKNPKSANNDWTIISPNHIEDFSQILNSNDPFSWNQIRFSLLNFLKNSTWDLYPFLEYHIDFNGDPVPDKYYTINSEWGYWDYLVNLTVIKPTIKESILKSFTTIF